MTSKTTNLDREVIAKGWRARGYSCDMWTSPPGLAWAGCVRNVDEILCVVRGQVVIETETQALQPRPGEEVPIPAGTRHSIRNTGATHATWLYGYRLD